MERSARLIKADVENAAISMMRPSAKHRPASSGTLSLCSRCTLTVHSNICRLLSIPLMVASHLDRGAKKSQRASLAVQIPGLMPGCTSSPENRRRERRRDPVHALERHGGCRQRRGSSSPCRHTPGSHGSCVTKTQRSETLPRKRSTTSAAAAWRLIARR